LTETEFLERWHAQKPIYEAWGKFVGESIQHGLLEIDGSIDLTYFIKVPAIPRLKTDDSLLGKAFHRGKAYTDPLAEIEDKVGIRFVVLLSSDIAKLSQVVEASPAWTFSLDRDFETEREKRPLEFAYQSKHYVVCAKATTEYGGTTIPKGTPCEIQLRTLLQHAHSELTHGPIYKPSTVAPVSGKVQRTVAKSMALIEAADDFFELVMQDLKQASEGERAALAILKSTYERHVNLLPSLDKTTSLILNTFKDDLGPDLPERLEALLERYPFVPQRIQERYARNYAYRQPWILLAYLLALSKPAALREQWPIGISELEAVYTDLGRRLNGTA
jgi:putative GTP pyrophosphokinase